MEGKVEGAKERVVSLAYDKHRLEYKVIDLFLFGVTRSADLENIILHERFTIIKHHPVLCWLQRSCNINDF